MATFTKILMPTDFSVNAQQALRYASMLAKKLDSDLTLLHVMTVHEEDPYNPVHNFPDLQDFYDHVEKSATSHLESIELDVNHYHTETVRGISPADEIIKYANEHGFDLIIMGTHGRAAIAHFLMGSVAERVVRHAGCPVITIAHQEKELYGIPKIARIAIPIDFSDFSKKVLKYSLNLARVFGARIDLLHVIDQRVHPSYYIVGQEYFMTIEPDLPEKALKTLREFVAGAVPDDVEVTYNILEGVPHDEIVAFATNEGTDLIMMTTHGLSGLEKMLIGSTTEKVVRKSRCPVFTVNSHLFGKVE
jgi:nucleotide-binding universal stress UspA family protein